MKMVVFTSGDAAAEQGRFINGDFRGDFDEMCDVNYSVFRKTRDEEKMVNILSRGIFKPGSHSISPRV